MWVQFRALNAVGTLRTWRTQEPLLSEMAAARYIKLSYNFLDRGQRICRRTDSLPPVFEYVLGQRDIVWSNYNKFCVFHRLRPLTLLIEPKNF